MKANARENRVVLVTIIRRLLRSRLTALVAVAAVAGVVVGTSSGAGRVSRVPTLEAQVLAAINGARLEHGLVPLRETAGLASAAQLHSLSMAEHGYFTHTSARGGTFGNRFGGDLSRYSALGETLAWASPGLTARQVLAMWLRSPPHRRTLLAPAWRDVGLGAVYAPSAPGVFAGRDVTILTVDFGSRS